MTLDKYLSFLALGVSCEKRGWTKALWSHDFISPSCHFFLFLSLVRQQLQPDSEILPVHTYVQIELQTRFWSSSWECLGDGIWSRGTPGQNHLIFPQGSEVLKDDSVADRICLKPQQGQFSDTVLWYSTAPREENRQLVPRRPEHPSGFQVRVLKGNSRGEGCRMCDQLVDPLLIGKWWGNRVMFQESQSSAFCFHLVEGL